MKRPWYLYQLTNRRMTTPSKPDDAKQKELAAVAGLAAKAVDVEDRKKSDAIEAAADERKEERREDSEERRDIRVRDERSASDVREKEFRKTILVVILAAIPTTLAATVGAYISFRDSAVIVSTHRLVNSGNLIQLKTIAALSHDKAERTKDPNDIRAADEADKAVTEHIAKQKLADEAAK